MAKKPEGDMDDEQIIRRRDGVPGASEVPLDSAARRALADARLRALAFALRSEQNTRGGLGDIDDADLLAYLLDSLPEERRAALEDAVRGDSRAFGRLMTLRAALGSQTDERDRQRADDLAKIPRHTAALVDIRTTGKALQFKDAREPQSPLVRLSRELEELAPAFERRSAFLLVKRPGLEWEIGGTPRNLLERARHDLDAGMSRVNEVRVLLERWWEVNRREETGAHSARAPGDREAENVRERLAGLVDGIGTFANRINEAENVHKRLAELLHELGMFADHINDELGDIASVAAGMFPPPAPETWSEAFAVEAGPWAVHLAGTAVPTPQLAVNLHRNVAEEISAEPFVTLVQPAQGFETVNLDPSGNGKIALPRGDSVMLVQGDEVWEVRLSFRH
jgi:hypothetical protein